MPRIRSVHPSLWTEEAFVSCSIQARLFAIGLWTEADDQGVFPWKPTVLKMRLYPADTVDVAALLAELETSGQIKRFIHDGHTFGAVRDFRKFQNPKKPNQVHFLPKELQAYVSMSKAGSEPAFDEHEQGPNLSPPSGEPVPNRSPPSGEPVPKSTTLETAPVPNKAEPVANPPPSKSASVPNKAETVQPKGEKSSLMEDGGWRGRREVGGEKKNRESSSSIRARTARDDDDLLRRLKEAAKGRVERGCANVDAIRGLIRDGCDLETEILPYVAATIPKLNQPLRSWNARWIAVEIRAFAEDRRADEARKALEPDAPPRPQSVFVAKDSPDWPSCAERYSRDKSTTLGPPSDAKSPTGKGSTGWYFPPEYLAVSEPKEDRRADEARKALEPDAPPRPQSVFVAKDSPDWPSCAERYSRDKSTTLGPPSDAKSPTGKGSTGWYFPPEYLAVSEPKMAAP